MRRNQHAIVLLFKELANAPWPLGVGTAFFFLLVGAIVGGMGTPGTPVQAVCGFGRTILFALAFGCLVAAVISIGKRFQRRHLLDRQNGLPSLRALSWRQFEQLVGEAYRRQGYDVEETGGGGADGGIDLILRGHGETVLVQCKQWRAQQVGVEKVRELFGVLHAEGASRGILVTSGRFTNEAQSFKVGKPLVLVDGPALAALVHEVRTQSGPHSLPTAKPSNCPTEPPPTCPKCNAPITLRTARRGNNAGNQFYGCTRYPDCKGIRDA